MPPPANGFSVREHHRNRKRNPEAKGAPPGGADERGGPPDGNTVCPPDGAPRFAVARKRSEPKERGRSEVKRSRAGRPHGEPRTESPSEAAERDLSPFPESALTTGRTTVANGAWDPPSEA